MKRRVHSAGYIDLFRPDHPLARSDGYVFEHRFVAYEAGWDLSAGWQIHHKNKVRHDNRLENLELVRIDDHARLHWDENRTTHCPQGHEYTPENTAKNPRGWRYCKQCNRDRARANKARKRLANPTTSRETK